MGPATDTHRRRRFATEDAAAAALAADLAGVLGRAIAARGAASLAVSGGSTPERVLPILARAGLAWDRVTVTLTDERWVAADDGASNEGLARRLLLQGPAAAATMIGLKTAAATPEDGLAEAEARLAGMAWPLDAVFLGMGADGHIASLFPGDGGWRARAGRCHAVARGPDGRGRIGLTAPALLDSREILLLVAGPDKARTLERAFAGGAADDLPLRHVVRQDRARLTLYAVRPAAPI